MVLLNVKFFTGKLGILHWVWIPVEQTHFELSTTVEYWTFLDGGQNVPLPGPINLVAR